VASGREPVEKRATLRALIRGSDNFKNAIIFCNRKRDVATLQRSLAKHGFNAGALHGDMDQRARTQTLDDFRKGNLALLVASDVAARGLDIPAVSHVLNFDVPTHAEDYIHRIGRTGRAGRSGTSITLAAPSDGKYVDAIEKLIQRDIPEVSLGRVEASSAEAPARGERSPREGHGERGGRGDRGGRNRGGRGERSRPPREEHAAAPKQEAAAPKQEPRPERQPERQRERHPERQPELVGDAPPRKQSAPRRQSSDSPFGNDGPIPAFLLRPGRVV
jgi:superfamily II DNA/RNA helicase